MLALVTKARLSIFPLYSFWCLIIATLVLTTALFIFDQTVLESKEQNRQLNTAAWIKEDGRIRQNLSKKIRQTWNIPLWESDGFTVKRAGDPKEVRILVIGDSFVWGDGAANLNDLWWRQLERELYSRGYQNLHVVGAGVCGSSTHTQLLQAQHLIPLLNPDLVIWGFVSNDPDEGLIKQKTSSPTDNSEFPMLIKGLEHIAPRLGSLLKDRRNKKLEAISEASPEGYYYLRWEEDLYSETNLEAYDSTLKKVSSFMSEQQVPFFFMTLPYYLDNRFIRFHDAVTPLFREAGLPFFDTYPDFSEQMSKLFGANHSIFDFSLNPSNGHPGPIVTKFLAERAVEFLELHHKDILGKARLTKNTPLRINDWMPYYLNPKKAERENTFVFDYPDLSNPEAESYMLRMPAGKPFVQLNLEAPKAIKGIALTGKGLSSASLGVTVINPRFKADDLKVIQSDTLKGSDLYWELDALGVAGAVNTVRISAEVKPSNSKVYISFIEK